MRSSRIIRNLTRIGAVATVAALAALAVLPTSTTAAPNADIPDAAEPQCKAFLTALNSDDGLDSCIRPLVKATELYQSGANKSASSADLSPTLDRMCAPDGDVKACDALAIRTNLTTFWNSCQRDIVNQLTGVYNVYDFLYVLTPFKDTICGTDSEGHYCLLNVAKAASSSSSSSSRRRGLVDDERDDDDEDVDVTSLPISAEAGVGLDEDDDEKDSTDLDVTSLRRRERYHAQLAARLQGQHAKRQATPDGGSDITDESGELNNGTSTNNIAFLFVKPDASHDVLCSECTRNILVNYIQFETSVPYAVGLSFSNFLQGQSALYAAAKRACGDGFAKDINARAGTSIFQEVGAGLRRVRVRGGPALASWMVHVGAVVVAGAVVGGATVL